MRVDLTNDYKSGFLPTANPHTIMGMKLRTALSWMLAAALALAAAVARADAGERDARSDDHGAARSGHSPEAGDNQQRVERRHFRYWRRESIFIRLSPEERHQLRRDIREAREGILRRRNPPVMPPPEDSSSR